MRGTLRNMLLPAAVTVLTAANIVGMDLTLTDGDGPRRKATAYQSIAGSLNPADSVFDDIRPDTVTAFDLSVDANDRYDNSPTYAEASEAMDSILRARRDSIVVPEHFRLTDPFLYKYYVATVDSFTHREVVDSLKAAGDSVDWPKIDFLYDMDSISNATAGFYKWYYGLDKVQRKKYDIQQMIIQKQRETDILIAYKDSVRAVRDSIREAKPRVLETAFLADSLQYRRLLTWHRERLFHGITTVEKDTSYNYSFHDYPIFRNDVNAVWAGVAGSPAQPMDWFRRGGDGSPEMFRAVEPWTFTPENITFYNTKTPYTELAYYGTILADSQKESDNLHILVSQNIMPEWNVTAEYDRFGGRGMLDNEATTNKTLTFTTNYVGKRYLAHAGYIYNMVSHEENGGVQDRSMIRDTTLDAREIAVRLTSAENLYKKNTVFLDQQYRIPLTFLKGIFRGRKASDTLSAALPSGSKVTQVLPDGTVPSGDSTALVTDRDVTTAFIGHSSEYSVYRKVYQDEISASDSIGRAFYHDNFYLNPTTSSDSMRVMKLENRIFAKLQPWKNDGIVSKLNVGLGNRILNWYLPDPTMLSTGTNTVWNSTYAFAGAEGRLKKYVSWDASGSLGFLGEEAGDFEVEANARLSVYPFRKSRTSPMTLGLHFSTTLEEPEYYQQHFISNHYRWDNDFGKISTSKLGAGLSIPRWRLYAEADYSLMSNNVWYDTTGTARQNAEAMSVFSASLRKDFTVGGFLHLDNRLLFQLSSNEDVVPLPSLAANLRWYVQFNVVRGVMQMQLGADTWINSKYYAPAWNPALGVFQSQKESKYGEAPYIDAFLNIQWKRACIFVKLENAGMGWPLDKADYFSAHNLIRTQRALKLGITWPFYRQPGKQKTLSERAGSALGGGGGGSLMSNLGGN